MLKSQQGNFYNYGHILKIMSVFGSCNFPIFQLLITREMWTNENIKTKEFTKQRCDQYTATTTVEVMNQKAWWTVLPWLVFTDSLLRTNSGLCAQRGCSVSLGWYQSAAINVGLQVSTIRGRDMSSPFSEHCSWSLTLLSVNSGR